MSHFSKFLGAGILSLSLMSLPSTLPASAQADTAAPSAPNAGVNNTQGDRDFDWGWLGLLGLLGLAGLTRKPEDRVAYREPDVATRSGYRD